MTLRILQLASFISLLYSCSSTDEQLNSEKIKPIEIHKVETLQSISEIQFEQRKKIETNSIQTEIPEINYTTNGFLYEKDSDIYHFNFSSKSSRKIYAADDHSTIDRFIHVEKRGLYILEKDDQFSRIVLIENLFTLQTETILSIGRWGGESSEHTIYNMNVSPTGDYMSYYSGGEVIMFDLQNKKAIDRLSEFSSFSEFVMWVPYNSVLLASGSGSEMNGPGDLNIIYLNLENRMYESWFIPNVIYSGFFSPANTLNIATILCRFDNTDIKAFRVGPLRELIEEKSNKSIQFEHDSSIWTVKLEKVNSRIINCKMSNSESTNLNLNYDLVYSHFNEFQLKSLKADTAKNNITIDFNVRINQRNYGSVQYVIDFEGNIVEKLYTNISESHNGFDLIQREHIIDSTSNIVNFYTNGYLDKSVEWDLLPSPIPSKIVYGNAKNEGNIL